MNETVINFLRHIYQPSSWVIFNEFLICSYSISILSTLPFLLLIIWYPVLLWFTKPSPISSSIFSHFFTLIKTYIFIVTFCKTYFDCHQYEVIFGAIIDCIFDSSSFLLARVCCSCLSSQIMDFTLFCRPLALCIHCLLSHVSFLVCHLSNFCVILKFFAIFIF